MLSSVVQTGPVLAVTGDTNGEDAIEIQAVFGHPTEFNVFINGVASVGNPYTHPPARLLHP